jgi:PII-like signaling protein
VKKIAMSLIGEQVLLRAYLLDGDRAPHVPTHELVVKVARSEKLAGATVLPGIAGYGYPDSGPASSWSLARHEPVIVEIVDSAEKIGAFVQGPLGKIMSRGILTLERASVAMYRQRPKDAPGRLAPALPQNPLSTLPSIKPRSAHMTIRENGILLRIFAGDSDRFDGRPLYDAVVARARELGLAGATVLRGSEGFGARSVVHKSSLLEMSGDLPIVIEIVDQKEKIELLLPHLESMVQEGMITMEYVMIVMYRLGEPGAKSERKCN